MLSADVTLLQPQSAQDAKTSLSLESERSFPAEPLLVSLSGPKLPGPGRELQKQVPPRPPYKGSSDRTDTAHVGARTHVRPQLIPRYSLFPFSAEEQASDF